MVHDDDEMWIAEGVWVPPGVADFIFSRIEWIREGEQADFQVGVPNGYQFDDLATLAHLIVTEDFAAAKVLAANLPRSQMWMEPSSSLPEGNANYLRKNPFKRLRGKQRKVKGEEKERIGKHAPEEEMDGSVVTIGDGDSQAPLNLTGGGHGDDDVGMHDACRKAGEKEDLESRGDDGSSGILQGNDFDEAETRSTAIVSEVKFLYFYLCL